MRDPPRSGSKLISPALDSLPLRHQESPRIFIFFFLRALKAFQKGEAMAGTVSWNTLISGLQVENRSEGGSDGHSHCPAEGCK